MTTAATAGERPKDALRALRSLARSYGVQTAHYDVYHRRQQADPEGIFCTLRALGAPLESLGDAPSALRARAQAVWQRVAEPVAVAWDGRCGELQIRLPADRAGGRVHCELTLEDGSRTGWSHEAADLATRSESTVEGSRYLAKILDLAGPVPLGYHKLAVEADGLRSEVLVVSAPSTSWAPPEGAQERLWGVFLPLHALHSEKSWGGGDLSDLEALFDWLGEAGGRVAGTLPMLASFLDEPFDPSPYAPASRLFWNELYVDVSRVPELPDCPPAQALLATTAVQTELAELRASPLVDYRRQYALKRRILSELARSLFSRESTRLAACRRFAESNPAVEDYARFRAAGDLRRAPWSTWPSRAREGILAASDYREDSRRYHLYAQWTVHDQLGSVSERARRAGQHLYLDLPLGVHPAGYDVWRHHDAFARDVSGGAPPDAVFTKGQDWNFPPLHPERIREQGYRYFIAGLRHQMAQASMLRVDHIMGLHRLFWIPKGLEAWRGAYVRYRAEEFYAILNLESYRRRAEVVGENLGTVPPYVNSTMARHKIGRMYVVQYELSPEHRRALKPVPPKAVASLNTHDMPPFAAFLRGLDLEDRLALGLLDEEGVRAERELRESVLSSLGDYLKAQGCIHPGAESDGWPLIRGCLEWLAKSRARVVLINLEDVWEETLPQNVPGTLDSRPNWRRKARYSLEQFSRMPRLLNTLRGIGRLRETRKGST